MANKLQKLLYNLSAISPILWIFSVLWYLEKSEVFVSVLSTCIGIMLAVYYFVFIYLCKNKMAKISIITQEIIPNDKWLIGYLIAYAIPFTSLAFDDINVIIFSLVSIVIVIAMMIANTSIPNPLLYLRGYHYYLVKSENGISEYLLASKRNLRSKSELNNVTRVFEYFIIDRGGE